MTDPSPSEVSSKLAKTAPTTPLRCLTGACLSGSLALLLYRLTSSVTQTLAAHPVEANSQLAQSLAVAVRTLVIGLCTLATGIFTLATVGLIGLALQLVIQRLTQPRSEPPSPTDTQLE